MKLVPEGAWDCHAHVIEDPRRYPLAPRPSYLPPPAPLATYLDLLDRYGFAHGVLIQPSVYGFDNRCLLDALDQAGGRLYGIATPSPQSTARDLEAMHRRGVRGVRCNLLYPGGLSLEIAETWVPVLQALGWHIEVHANTNVMDLPAVLTRLGVPVVIDHMGRSLSDAPAASAGEPGAQRDSGNLADSAAANPLVDAVRQGLCYVKLSAPYRLSRKPPPWPDVTPLAAALAAANPQRCFWASDWPHTDTAASITIEALLEALAEWCPDARTRERILTESPSTLFKQR